MQQIIEIENVSKRYRIGRRRTYVSLRDEVMRVLKSPFRRHAGEDGGDPTIWALKDVSFSVKEGEVVGIIGRNGAGKTTLLKILSRITEPTEGRITLRGRVASLLEVGTGFHSELTGRENIFLNGALLGMTSAEIRRKFDDIVAFSEVEMFLDTPVKRYSSGMYMRLAFAVAAHLEPEILVVDEVLAVGDAQFQKKCLGKMGDVARSGRTVLFVSHNMAAVESLCQRAVLLERGKLERDDAVKPVVDDYLKMGVEPTAAQLSDRKDVIGNGRARFTAIGIRALDDAASAIRCGDRIRIEVSYAAGEPLANYALVLAILDQRGVPIYWLDSRYDPALSASIPSTGRLRCDTAPLNLVPGAYVINAAMLVNNEVATQIESAASFVVESQDFYGVGRLPAATHGMVLITQKWHAE